MVVSGSIDTNGNEETLIFNKETSRNIDIGTIDTTDITSRIKNGIEILIVDDNKVNRVVLIKMLEFINAHVLDEACDGNEALRMTRMKNYDLIFMDKFMPVMDGIDTTKHIRNDFDCLSKNSRILFLSADTEDETIAECMNAGANGFLPKPYRIQLLIDKIWKVAPHVLIENEVNN